MTLNGGSPGARKAGGRAQPEVQPLPRPVHRRGVGRLRQRRSASPVVKPIRWQKRDHRGRTWANRRPGPRAAIRRRAGTAPSTTPIGPRNAGPAEPRGRCSIASPELIDREPLEAMAKPRDASTPARRCARSRWDMADVRRPRLPLLYGRTSPDKEAGRLGRLPGIPPRCRGSCTKPVGGVVRADSGPWKLPPLPPDELEDRAGTPPRACSRGHESRPR